MFSSMLVLPVHMYNNLHFRTGMAREADQFSFELCTLFTNEENSYYPNEIKQLNYSYGVPENFHLSEMLL